MKLGDAAVLGKGKTKIKIPQSCTPANSMLHFPTVKISIGLKQPHILGFSAWISALHRNYSVLGYPQMFA